MSEVDDQLPPVIPVSYSKVMSMRKRLNILAVPYLDRQTDADVMKGLTLSFSVELHPRKDKNAFGELDGAPDAAIYETLAAYIEGAPFTREAADRLISAIAGNSFRLVAGAPLRPWMAQPITEWVLLRVKRAKPYVTKKTKKFGAMVTFDVLTGYPAGVSFDQFLSNSLMEMLSDTLSIHTKYSMFSFEAPDMVGTLMLGLITKGLDLRAHRFAPQPALRAHNLKLSKLRGEERKCPFRLNCSCSRCLRGWDTCQLAVHPRSLERRACCAHALTGLFYLDEPQETLCTACKKKIADDEKYKPRGPVVQEGKEDRHDPSDEHAGGGKTSGAES